MGHVFDLFFSDAIRADYQMQRRRFQCHEADLMGNESDVEPSSNRREKPGCSAMGNTGNAATISGAGGNDRRAYLQAQLASINERLLRLASAAKLNARLAPTIQQLRLQRARLASELTQLDSRRARG